MNSLYTAILDLLQLGEKQKAELLIKSKELIRLRDNAKIEIKSLSDDSLDELALAFADKLQNYLKAL